MQTKQDELAHAYRTLNQEFKSRPQSRPFVTLSFAQSLDGCIAAGRGQRLVISGQESLALTHAIRSWNDAILIGIGTVLIDDPQLTVRLTPGSNPVRVILDSTLRTPLDAKVLDQGQAATWIVTKATAPRDKMRAFTDKGIEVLPLDSDHGLPLADVLSALWQKGVTSVMVEGGAQVISSFLKHKLVDFLIITIAPIFLGHSGSPRYHIGQDAIPVIKDLVMFEVGQDQIAWGQPEWPPHACSQRGHSHALPPEPETIGGRPQEPDTICKVT